ncbi:hypothetical protein HDU85_001018 [Gaertneriomyces sp. JEL0708]|nr:hypothetical protein HDU85_001018 [Gaertneriomyces sp. JEL0708]
MVMTDEDVLYLVRSIPARKLLLHSYLAVGLITYDRIFRLCCTHALALVDWFLDRPELVKAIPLQLEDIVATTPSHYCDLILDHAGDIHAEDVSEVIERGLIRKQHPLGTVKVLIRRNYLFTETLVHHFIRVGQLASVEHIARSRRVDLTTHLEEHDNETNRIRSNGTGSSGRIRVSDPNDATQISRAFDYFLGLWYDHGGGKTWVVSTFYELAMDIYWQCNRIMLFGFAHKYKGKVLRMPMEEYYDRWRGKVAHLANGVDYERDEDLDVLSNYFASVGISYQRYMQSLVSDAFVPQEQPYTSMSCWEGWDKEYLRQSRAQRADLPQHHMEV